MNIGIDVGARHISTAIVDENGNILFRLDPILHKNISENDFINLIKQNINTVLKNTTNIKSIGISLPGNCENGILLEAPNIGLKNVNINKALLDFDIPIHIENDAVCALIGESTFGNLKEYQVSLMLTIGTDIGYAISNIKKNDIIYATDYFRDRISLFNKQFNKNIKSSYNLQCIYSKQTKKDVRRYEIFKDIKNGDKTAIEIFENYINDNCIGIKRICDKLKIYTVCIGGGLSEYSEFFEEKIKKNLPNMNIFISKYKNDSGIVGASLLPCKYKKVEMNDL